MEAEKYFKKAISSKGLKTYRYTITVTFYLHETGWKRLKIAWKSLLSWSPDIIMP